MSLQTFRPSSVITSADMGGEQFAGCIQCMELSQNNLYLATTDRYIYHFFIEKSRSTSGEETFKRKLQRKKHMGFSKPIKQLLTCPVIGQLLALSDNIVYVLSMIGLEFRGGAGKELFKGVTVLARNDTSAQRRDDIVQICIGTHRKTIQIIDLAQNRFTLVREISLRGSPLLLSFDGDTICAAVGRQYYLVHVPNSQVQELFMCEENVVPHIKRTAQEEFLLNGPTNEMGMVVTAGGVSQHQPLWWSDTFRGAAYLYPYVLVLGRLTITVHSILDQKEKQVIPLNGGVLLDDFHGSVYVAYENSVVSLSPITLREQIQMLLVEKRVEETFDLLHIATQSQPREYNEEYKKRIQAQAGFIYFADAEFKKAMNLFLECSLDPREVIVLYPLMMSKGNTFTPSRPLLHNIDNLSALVKGSRPLFANYKKFLLEFMQISRHRFPDANAEIDTALLKVYAESDHVKLSELVSQKNNISTEDAFSWLSQFKRHHCEALYHNYLGQHSEALTIWYRLIYNELEDQKFPGVEFVVDFLIELDDVELIFSSMKWLLDRDQVLAVKVFTQRTGEKSLDSNRVYNFIPNYPVALRIYLEHVVFELNCETERFHTRLAMIYIDEVLKLLQDNIAVDEDRLNARTKLQVLLESSNFYEVPVIFERIHAHPLHEEIAILYGKLNQHDKALAVLVYQLKNYDVAERYCNTVCLGQDKEFRNQVFYTLLCTYLKPTDESVRPEHLVMPAVRLLNSHQKDFNFLQVLEILPDDWPVEMISKFFSGSVRSNLLAFHQTRIETSICKVPYVETKAEVADVQRDHVMMTKELQCMVCEKPFTNSTCVRYPNGIIAHPKCCKHKTVCPVTGTKFK